MKVRFAAMLSFFLMSSAVFAGVVFEIETKDHTKSNAEMEKAHIKADGKKLTMEMPSNARGNDGDMIYRGDNREMLVVNHDDKSFMSIDMEAIKALAGQMSQVMSQMQEALKNVPESQRAMMEKMMKDKMPKSAGANVPKVEIKKTGKRDKLNGYPCTRYDVIQEGEKVREMWVTDWKNVDGGKEAIEVFEDMAAFFEELMKALSSAGGQGLNQMSKNMFAHMKELDGFPVVTRDFENGELTTESFLRSSKKVKIDPADFEPPAGYKRQQMMKR